MEIDGCYTSSMSDLQLIDGGKDELEKTFQRLMSAPETFTQDEFEQLVDVTFRDRLSRGEIFELMEKQLRNGRHESPLEAKALLAIMEGDRNESGRLLGILDRCNSLGLKVISSEKESPRRDI